MRERPPANERVSIPPQSGGARSTSGIDREGMTAERGVLGRCLEYPQAYTLMKFWSMGIHQNLQVGRVLAHFSKSQHE